MQEGKLDKEKGVEEKEEIEELETEGTADSQGLEENVDEKDTVHKEEKSAKELVELLNSTMQEHEELVSRYQRLQADFENYKRRSRKELENMAKFGIERLVLGLLPVLDNFIRALEAAPKEGEVGKFMSGMDMIYRQSLEVLENEGVKIIEAVGQPFDPEKHHAVMQVEAENAEEDNLIKEELQIGYTLNDKVIRPSMVKVAKYNE